MTRYRTIPVYIEATQWFQNGDHPKDGTRDQEGKVVRYYRFPSMNANKCTDCGYYMYDHGWIDQINDHVVCPGDWVIEGTGGRYHVERDMNFRTMYEPVE